MPKHNDNFAMENCRGFDLQVTRMISLYPVAWITLAAIAAVTLCLIRQIGG